jgi:hypothetical protein
MEQINNKDVTAKWARETATAILGEKVQEQINRCLNSVRGAVSRNEMSISINVYADNLTIQELSKRGFKVKQEDDQRDGPYLIISW